MSAHIRNLLLAATVLAAGTATAVASDLPAKQRAKAVAPAPVVEAFNPWMLRVRAIAVMPTDSAGLYTGGSRLVGSSVGISDMVMPEVDVSYFFTKNIAVEAICCVTPHKVKGTGGLAGYGEIGKTLLFPPTVLAQYHFTDLGAFKPYVGVGVNYTHYFMRGSGPNYSGFKLKDSWGVAGQIGFDYMLDKNWGINFDIKKIMMEPDGSVTLNPSTAVTAKVKINPWIIGTGVTYKF